MEMSLVPLKQRGASWLAAGCEWRMGLERLGMGKGVAVDGPRDEGNTGALGG